MKHSEKITPVAAVVTALSWPDACSRGERRFEHRVGGEQ
jgi:hypothetical protein